eukprot:4164747-Lingulodinium_polyedra.AAC.1
MQNSVSLTDGRHIYTEQAWIEEKEDMGMSTEDAKALWEKRINAPGAQVIEYHGMKALVRARASRAEHHRQQQWT